MSRKFTKSTRDVLKSLRNYRNSCLKESLLGIKTLSKTMEPLLKYGIDRDNKIALTKAIEDDQGGFIFFDNEVIERAQELLTEIFSGYWKDSNKLFEILNPKHPAYELFACYEEDFSQLQKLKERYDVAGEDLSKYLK